jgi:thymidine phosphorylase
VGLTSVAGLGRRVERGEPLALVHARDEAGAGAAALAVRAAFTLGDAPEQRRDLIRARIG